MPVDPYRSVVKAVDRLTTQVRRVADAMATPVVEDADTLQTTGNDDPAAVKLGSWVPACPTGRHVTHGGMDCDEVDEWKATFDQWMSSAAAQFASVVTTPVVTKETPDDDPHQPAYDAVFAYIRSQPRDFLPDTVVGRNAMIWHAVHAALDAMPGQPDGA